MMFGQQRQTFRITLDLLSKALARGAKLLRAVQDSLSRFKSAAATAMVSAVTIGSSWLRKWHEPKLVNHHWWLWNIMNYHSWFILLNHHASTFNIHYITLFQCYPILCGAGRPQAVPFGHINGPFRVPQAPQVGSTFRAWAFGPKKLAKKHRWSASKPGDFRGHSARKWATRCLVMRCGGKPQLWLIWLWMV